MLHLSSKNEQTHILTSLYRSDDVHLQCFLLSGKCSTTFRIFTRGIGNGGSCTSLSTRGVTFLIIILFPLSLLIFGGAAEDANEDFPQLNKL